MTSFGEGIQILCGNLLQAFTGSDLIELRLNLRVRLCCEQGDDDDHNHTEDECRQKFIDSEQTAEGFQDKLPEEDHYAAGNHTGNIIHCHRLLLLLRQRGPHGLEHHSGSDFSRLFAAVHIFLNIPQDC